VTSSQSLLKTTPEESETVQTMPCVALRNTAGTSAGRNTASPRPLPAPNPDGTPSPAGRHPDVDAPRRPKRKASVRPLVVAVPHVLIDNTSQVASTPYQHPVQAHLPYGSHPPLRECIRVRRLDRRLDDLEAAGGEDGIEGTGELAVAVTNEEPEVRWFPAVFSLSRRIESSGRLTWRRSTSSWWRRTAISTSLACSLRALPSSMSRSRCVMR
jgi:hypothetical protein